MKIYRSSISVKDKEWYQLEVINMWDWGSERICFEKSDDHVFAYKLKHNKRVEENRWKSEDVTELTDEMKTTLQEMGYELAKKFLNG